MDLTLDTAEREQTPFLLFCFCSLILYLKWDMHKNIVTNITFE